MRTPKIIRAAEKAMHERQSKIRRRFDNMRERYCKNRGGHDRSHHSDDIREVFGGGYMPITCYRCDICGKYWTEDKMTWEEWEGKDTTPNDKDAQP